MPKMIINIWSWLKHKSAVIHWGIFFFINSSFKLMDSKKIHLLVHLELETYHK